MFFRGKTHDRVIKTKEEAEKAYQEWKKEKDKEMEKKNKLKQEKEEKKAQEERQKEEKKAQAEKVCTKKFKVVRDFGLWRHILSP